MLPSSGVERRTLSTKCPLDVGRTGSLRAAALQDITDLTGYEMYVTAYPCPMCLGALYYATPDRVVYAATREQEGEHYDDGNRYMSLRTFYDEYAKPIGEQNLPLVQGNVTDPTAPFRRWSALND